MCWVRIKGGLGLLGKVGGNGWVLVGEGRGESWGL